MFNIIDNKGFHITFSNGNTISVQFGYLYYCKNRNNKDFRNNRDFRESVEPCPDCEIAIWDKNNNWLTDEITGCGDDVMGYVKPDELAEIIMKVKKYKGE